MKILLINTVCGIKSTGRICTNIASNFEADGHTVKIAYGRGKVPAIYKKNAVRICSGIGVIINALLSRIFDNEGLNARLSTKLFLKWAGRYNPDLIWIHNLHGYYINYELLFNWIKKRPTIQIYWTIHDCWPITGHCTHFSFVKCYSWKSGCKRCIQKKMYPKSIMKDNCINNYRRKKDAFCNVHSMTIISPSKWLSDILSKSFLNEYKINVQNNTIDDNVFKPTSSSFRKQFNLTDKIIILGVSSVWNERKGFFDFLKLSNMLEDKFVIVLVGLTKRQAMKMPKNIVGITHTSSTIELAQIYTAADIFLNLSYEENYPTVNLESQKCGTPCVTYRTGGSVESVPEDNIVEQGDLATIVRILHDRLIQK